MSDKINKLYKPAELVEAQQVLIKANMTPDEASQTIIKLFNAGYRIVKIQ